MSDEQQPSDFERLAAEEASPGLLREFVDFLRFNKKWWLLPMIIVLLLMGVLIFLSATPVAPFIYTLF